MIYESYWILINCIFALRSVVRNRFHSGFYVMAFGNASGLKLAQEKQLWIFEAPTSGVNPSPSNMSRTSLVRAACRNGKCRILQNTVGALLVILPMKPVLVYYYSIHDILWYSMSLSQGHSALPLSSRPKKDVAVQNLSMHQKQLLPQPAAHSGPSRALLQRTQWEHASTWL